MEIRLKTAKQFLPSGHSQSNILLWVYVYNFNRMLQNQVLKKCNTKNLSSVDRKVVREGLYETGTPKRA